MKKHNKRILVEWFVRSVSLAVLVLGVVGFVGKRGIAAVDKETDAKLYDDTLPMESSVNYITSLPQLESRIRFDRDVLAKGGQEISLRGSNCRLKVNRIKAEDRKFETGSEYIVSKISVKKDSISIQASNAMYQPGGFEIRCDAAADRDWRQAKVGEIINDLGGNFSITE